MLCNRKGRRYLVTIGKIKVFINNPSIKYTLMSIIASGVNFVTLIVWGRIFSVEEYGIVTALQAFVSNVTTFMLPLQIIICKMLAEKTGDLSRNSTSIISVLGLINIIELLVMIIGAGALIDYLHLVGIVEYLLFIGLVFSNNFYTIFNGVVQGKQDFILLGRTAITFVIVKMSISVSLVICGFSSSAVIIGYAAAAIVCIILMGNKLLGLVKKLFCGYRFWIDMDFLKSYGWTLVLYIVVSLYLNNGDILLGNLYCGKEEIGLYSVAANLTKISIFLIATPIATILLPKVVSAGGDEGHQNKLLLISEIITFGISILYEVCLGILGRWIIPLLYGEAYTDAIEYLLPCMVFSVVMGMFWVFYQYALATDLAKPFMAFITIIGIVVIICILIIKCQIGFIPIIMAGAMGMTVISVFIYKKMHKTYKYRYN